MAERIAGTGWVRKMASQTKSCRKGDLKKKGAGGEGRGGEGRGGGGRGMLHKCRSLLVLEILDMEMEIL